MVGTVIGALALSFLFGALARFALPGPDPMPLWLTMTIGLLGFLGGTGIVLLIGGRKQEGWFPLVVFFIAVCLVVLYRRFVQKRPLWGKGAYRFPDRGFGVENYRERLRQAGIDPDQIGVSGKFGVPENSPGAPRPVASTRDDPGEPTENPAYYLGLLEELHDSGVLDDTEYNESRTRLLESLR